MFKTIKFKFIFFTIIFIIVSVGIPTFFLLTQFKNNFHQRSETMLKTTLEVVHRGLINSMMLKEHQPENIKKIIRDISQNQSIAHIRIFNKEGNILYATNENDEGNNITNFDPHHMDDIPKDKTIISLVDERSVYSATKPIYNEKSCQECHKEPNNIISYLDVDIELTPAERAFYTGSMHIIMLSALIVIVLVMGFYFLYNHFINKPLQKFIVALDRVESGDLKTHLPEQKEDEFGIIDKHFNNMVSKLNDSQKKITEMHFEQLQRADKLVTLGELAAEMAHEINNPAAIIMSRADYMQLELQDNPSLAQYNDDLEVIFSQIQKVSKITGSILKYSKKLPHDFQAINLLLLVDESIRILEPRLQKKNISFNKEYKCQYDCECALIQGDPQQIEQMVTNIVNNAIDAIEDGGKLNITIECLNNFDTRITIADNGCGMDESVKSQIFSPFYTTKSAEKGTGLGLYIVKNICNNHNAEIECESEIGRGTIFKILFKKDGNVA